MQRNDDERTLLEAFGKMSFEGKAEVMERALLVEKIEKGVRKEYGLPDEPPQSGKYPA
jgi:hypothetical protein